MYHQKISLSYGVTHSTTIYWNV